MNVLDSSVKPLLPSPDTIYYKDFHFLDEPLIHRRYPLQKPVMSQ